MERKHGAGAGSEASGPGVAGAGSEASGPGVAGAGSEASGPKAHGDRRSLTPGAGESSPSRLLQVAGVVFVIGVLAIIALFVTPVADHGETAPTAVYLLTMCAPLGFLLGVVYALRSGRGAR